MGSRYRICLEVDIEPAARPSFTAGRAGRVAELTRDFVARIRHVEAVRALRLEPLDLADVPPRPPAGLEVIAPPSPEAEAEQ